MSTISHRGSRCGVCYWALYDGDWCQNRNCVMSGKSVGENRVMLTNLEAQILIAANSPKIAADIARCNGVGDDAEGWREGCETCLRRTSPRPERVVMIAPPEIIAFECEYLIEP